MLWYSLEAPRRGASNEYPQHMFSWRNKKNISTFGLKKSVLTSAMTAADVKLLPVLHCSVLYIFWAFVIIEPIPGCLKTYMRVTAQ